MRRAHAGAEALTTNLDELRRQDRVELVRKPLEDYAMLSPSRSGDKEPVTVDALKKLVRRWKLHEQREFWKHHTTRDQLVDVLIEYMKTHPTYEHLRFDPVDNPAPRKPQSPPRSTKAPRPGGRAVSARTAHLINSDSAPFLAKARYNRDTLRVPCVTDFLAEWNDVTNGQRTISAAETAKLTVFPPDTIVKRRNVAQQLMEFSFAPQGLEAILQGESLMRVLEMFNTSDETICSACVIAISNVVQKKTLRAELYEAGLLDVLARVHQYCRGFMAVRACALILYHLSCSIDYEERIFSSMVHFLHGCISEQAELELQELTILTLHNLLPCLERHSVVRSMFACLKLMVPRQQASVEMMAILLRNVTSYASIHFSIIEQGVIGFLKDVLSLQPTNPGALLDVAQAVANLISSPDVFTGLLSQPLLPLLKNITDAKDTASARLVALSVAQFTMHADTAEAVSQSAGLELFRSLAHSGLPAVIQAAVAAALANLTVTTSEGCKNAAILQQLHSLLAELLFSAGDARTVELAALTGLCNLVPHPRLEHRYNEQLCTRLAPYLAPSKPLETRLITARTVCNIVQRSSPAVEHLLSDELLEQLMVVLGEDDAELSMVALETLKLFCRTEVCVRRVLNERLLNLLLKHSRADASVREPLSTLFSQLLELSGSELDGHFSNVLQVASSLMEDASSAVVFHNCCRAMCALSLHLDRFALLYPLAKRIILANPQTSSSLLSAITLFNLCCMPGPDADEIRTDHAALAAMVDLMRTGDAATQMVTSKTFCLLSVCPTFTEAMLMHKIVEDYIVTAILRTNETAVKLLCARTLYNMLAFGSFRPQLVAVDAFWAVIKLSRDSHPDLQALGSRIVLHFTSDPNLLPVLRKHKVFGSLLQLVNDDLSTCQLVLDATKNLLTVPLLTSELLSCYKILAALVASPAEHELLDAVVQTLGFVFQQLATEPENLLLCVKDSFLELLPTAVGKKHLPHTRYLLAAILTNVCRTDRWFEALPVAEFLNGLAIVCGIPQELSTECTEQVVLTMAMILAAGGEWATALPTTRFAWKALRHAAERFSADHPVVHHALRITVQLLEIEQATLLRRHAAYFQLLKKQTASSVLRDEQLYLISVLSSDPDLSLEMLHTTPILELLGERLTHDVADEATGRAVGTILRNLTAFEESCFRTASERSIDRTLLALKEHASPGGLGDLVIIGYHIAVAVSFSAASVSADFVLSFLTDLKNLAQEQDRKIQQLSQAALARVVQLLGTRVSRNKDMISAILMDADNDDCMLESHSQVVLEQFRLTKHGMHPVQGTWFNAPRTSPSEWQIYRLPSVKEALPTAEHKNAPYAAVRQLFKIRTPSVMPWSKYEHQFATRLPIEAVRLSKQMLAASIAHHRFAELNAALQCGAVMHTLPTRIAMGEPICVVLADARGVLNTSISARYVSPRLPDILAEVTQEVPTGSLVCIPAASPLSESLAKVPISVQAVVGRQTDGSVVLGLVVSCSSATELLFECYGSREIVLSNLGQFEVALHADITIVPSTAKQWSSHYTVLDEDTKEPVTGATVSWAGPITGSSSGDGSVRLDDADLPDGVYAVKISSPAHSTVARKLVKLQSAANEVTAPYVVELQRKAPEEVVLPPSPANSQRRNSYHRRYSSRSSTGRKTSTTLGKSLEIIS